MSVMSHNLRFKHPFTWNISGLSWSGTSSFCIQFLQNLDPFCTQPSFDEGIMWCYGEKRAFLSHQLSSAYVVKNIRFQVGVPDNLANAEGKVCLISLDDILNEVYSKEVCHLFTKGTKYRNISVVIITANLFHQGRYCRAITLNAKFLVLLKNVRNNNLFSHLARQVYREESASLYEVYLHATKQCRLFLCWIYLKIRMTYCGSEPTYSQRNIRPKSMLR